MVAGFETRIVGGICVAAGVTVVTGVTGVAGIVAAGVVEGADTAPSSFLALATTTASTSPVE